MVNPMSARRHLCPRRLIARHDRIEAKLSVITADRGGENWLRSRHA